MAKPKRKERIQNREPFVPDGTESLKLKKRSKGPKQHQKERNLIDSNISSKIMKEALIQQKEIQEEEEEKENAKSSFHGIEELPKVMEYEDDIDDFAALSGTQSQFGGYEVEIDEEDERIMEVFLSKDQGWQKTVADCIVERIKEKDSSVALDKYIIDMYKGVGTHLSKYTVCKIPKAIKHIPSMQLWEEILCITEPENWSPNALYEVTRIFASNFDAKKAECFYKLVLLPRVREEIRKNKRLHFSVHQALKKALYKPAAFFKGILFPLCRSHTCTLREARIVGSIIKRVSIPSHHSSVVLLKLAGMEYCGARSYFISLFLEKKYALSRSVVDAVRDHFMRSLYETRTRPVIWHQSLLAFVQRYKNELRKEDKDHLRVLLEKQNHKLITPEISRELNHRCNQDDKEDDLMSISSPMSLINKPIEEDRFDIPDIPMEDY